MIERSMFGGDATLCHNISLPVCNMRRFMMTMLMAVRWVTAALRAIIYLL